MPFVIVRNSDGRFVSNANLNPSGSSYARSLQMALLYPTREAALADKCENEHVKAVHDCFLSHRA